MTPTRQRGTLSLIGLLLAIVGMLFPLAWMLLLSLHTTSSSSLATIVSQPPTLSNYSEMLSQGAFGRYFFNSVLVSVVTAAGNVLLCAMVATALARREFRGRGLVFGSVLAVLIMPAQVVMIPLYRMMVGFGWINTYWALIMPWIVTPFGIFLVRQHLLSTPPDLEDAARLDGASELSILFRVIIPLARPMLVVLGVSQFLATWNSFLFPFLFTTDDAMRTIPVALAFFQGKQSIDWGHLMAAATLSAAPVILLFIAFQRQIVAGLMSGALKQ
jgi:multiple sugar transport system permease protein